MFLDEVHAALCSGELSQSIVGDSAELLPEAIPKINVLIQAGINDLNNKFAIRENQLLLRTNPDRTVYELVPSNAVSSGNPNAFIIDSVDEPYDGDLAQVFKLEDANGQSLWLNTDVAFRHDVENLYGKRASAYTHNGINFNAYNTIRLNKGNTLGDIVVFYKARLKPMDTNVAPFNTFIDLPDHFLNALVWYVVARKHNPKGAETIGRGMFHEGDNYWAKYIAEVTELKTSYANIASTGESTTFVRNGWV